MSNAFKSFLMLTLLACGGDDISDVVTSNDMNAQNPNDLSMEGPHDMGLADDECVIDSVIIDAGEQSFEIFAYEASGSAEMGVCSMPGRVPLSSLTQAKARLACETAGWRLCSLKELRRACEGNERRRFPYGARLVEGRCNIRDGYIPEGASMSAAAPSGYFEQCVSQDGVYDLTGNVWEWAAIQGETYVYYGSGYRIIAERHRDEDHACDAFMTLPPIVGEPYQKETVGFRCCKDALE